MAYTINKTDGTILANVPDGQIDKLTSDITLIGKNYSGFGEALNENFVKLLENFSSSNRPSRPITGQVWFDSSELKLKVYTGTGFVPVSSATISNVRPPSLGVGDLWFNNVDKQLYFFDGTNTILLGPDYSTSQGISGIKVATVLDKTNSSRVITLFYTNGTLLGIFSKDEFLPKVAIPGFNEPGEDKIIFPGFNAGNLGGLKFNVTAANAERLDNLPASEFARRDRANIFDGQISIKSNEGIIIGEGFQAVLQVDIGNVILANTFANRDLEFRVKKGIDAETAIKISSFSRQVDLYQGKEDSVVNVGGSLVVEQNLTVKGSTTTISTVDTIIQDRLIELAVPSVGPPTDDNADTGGFVLKGTTDHAFIWKYNTAVSGSNYANIAWNSTEHINLVSSSYLPTPAYKINGVKVIDATSLGDGITSLPGVKRIGIQTSVDVGPAVAPSPIRLTIENNRISTVVTGQDLELSPAGDISLIGNKKIKGVTTTGEGIPSQSAERPSLLQSIELSESVNKRYLLNFVRRRSIVLSIDTSDNPGNEEIAGFLTLIAPPTEFENGTLARLLCTSVANQSSTVDLYRNINQNLDRNTEYLKANGGSGFPVQDFDWPFLANQPVILSPQTLVVTRSVKIFIIRNGKWDFDSSPTILTLNQTISIVQLTVNVTVSPVLNPITVIAGTQPYSYSITPSLPTGLSFDPITGGISGTPTVTSNTTTYTVTVTDQTGQTNQNTFTLTVNDV